MPKFLTVFIFTRAKINPGSVHPLKSIFGWNSTTNKDQNVSRQPSVAPLHWSWSRSGFEVKDEKMLKLFFGSHTTQTFGFVSSEDQNVPRLSLFHPAACWRVQSLSQGCHGNMPKSFSGHNSTTRGLIYFGYRPLYSTSVVSVPCSAYFLVKIWLLWALCRLSVGQLSITGQWTGLYALLL